MEFITGKSVAFKPNEEEAKALTDALAILKIDCSALTARETMLVFAQKAVEVVNALANVNQDVNTELSAELSEENSALLRTNQELTEKNLELSGTNSELSATNLELSDNNLELTQENNELKNADTEQKEVIKEVPVKLTPFQIIVTLNHFQLFLLAKVANNHLAENTYNEKAEKDVIAFCRIEGDKKTRIAQTLINIFIGFQFNFHKGDDYLPQFILTKSDIKKAYTYHLENTETEE